MCVKRILWYTEFSVERVTVYQGAWNGHPEFQSAIILEISGRGSTADADCSPKPLRASRHGHRQRSAAECVHPPGCENGHQLSRHMDLLKRVAGVPSSSPSSTGCWAI